MKRLLMQIYREIEKAFSLAKKMIGASRTTSSLNLAYKELGVIFSDALLKKEIICENPKVKELLLIIERYHTDLIIFEEQIQKIKTES